MFCPRLALASLSGESDADWALGASEHAGAAFLGGIALCPRTREAARAMVARGRSEFLPADPFDFVENQLATLASVDVRTGVNVRTVDPAYLRRVASICAEYDAIVEINAHCRQEEMCAVGAGETLLRDTERLAGYVAVAAEGAAPVGVKVRAEVPGVDLVGTARGVVEAGASVIHVDAMDSEWVVADVVDAADCFVIANNGVRDRASVETYLGHGADAVSVGRPSDNQAVLARVHEAVGDQ